MTKNKVIITIDVEAQPKRAYDKHVDKLIFGKFLNNQTGINEMMSIAKNHNILLTFFLDLCEVDIYGDSILDVGREIISQGHDLQLHAHYNFLFRDIWSKNNAKVPLSMETFNIDQSKIMIEYIVNQYKKISNISPIAYRGGSYRYNNCLLEALHNFGIKIDSSHNSARYDNMHLIKPFEFMNGIIELPISCINNFRNLNGLIEFNFNKSLFKNSEIMIDYLNSFFNIYGNQAIAILVMHSWSFLDLVDNKFFEYKNDSKLIRFENFLSNIKNKYEVLSCKQFLDFHST